MGIRIERTREWRIDDSVVSLGSGGMFKLKVDVDGRAEAILPVGVQGRFVIPWKRKRVELRLVGPSNGIEGLLFVDDLLVAPSKEAPVLGDKTKCKAHGKETRRRCPSCDDVVCARDLSVDGVRCEACFATAGEAARSNRRRGWFLGAGALLLLALIGFFLGTQGVASDFLPRIAGAFIAGAILMAFTGFRQKDGAGFGAFGERLAITEDPQIVGARCPDCKKKVSRARDGEVCEGCERAVHAACLEAHACRPAKRGPDWAAIRADA